MLFKLNIDSEINLVFLHESLSAELFNLVDSDRKHLNTWLPWPPFIEKVEDTKSFIKTSIVDFAEGKSMVCAIVYKNKIVGVVSFNKILTSLKKVEIGYWLSSKYQGNGIMSRAVKCLINEAFDDLEMKKVEISVATENYPSQRICERLGFNPEGVIKNSENLHGKIVDHVIYGLYNEK